MEYKKWKQENNILTLNEIIAFVMKAFLHPLMACPPKRDTQEKRKPKTSNKEKWLL